ncbi:MAG: hypothetical protein ACWA40_05860 [Planktomarina sp.]
MHFEDEHQLDTNIFFKALGPDHKAVYIRGNSTLVVTFESEDDIQTGANRMPWGLEFIASEGRSFLGIMAHKPTWYRSEDVFDFFDGLKQHDFFKQFERVVFYGASMGGYAAAAFSSSCPGAHVIAISPQATLDKQETEGWEPRFRWIRNSVKFKGRYSNAVEQLEGAASATVFYDPFVVPDKAHALRFSGDHVRKIVCRHMTHDILESFTHIGIKNDLLAALIDGNVSELDIYKALRARTRAPSFQSRFLKYLTVHRRMKHAARYAAAVVKDSAPTKRPRFAAVVEREEVRAEE